MCGAVLLSRASCAVPVRCAHVGRRDRTEKKEQGHALLQRPQPLVPACCSLACRTARRGASGLSLPRLGPRGEADWATQPVSALRCNDPKLSRAACHHSTQARPRKRRKRTVTGGDSTTMV